MTEKELRNLVVTTAKNYLGLNEADGSHLAIVAIYNSQKELPRGYRVQKTDSWCAATVSAVAIECKLTDIMPTECSCGKMVELYKKLGRWMETDTYIPQAGDIVMYDWNDTGSGDNTGWPDHVGIVVGCDGKSITVIEGNKNDTVGYRRLSVGGKYIRGYCLPDYASKATKATATAKAGISVLEWQQAAIKDGFKFPKFGADGVWGPECESVARKAIVKKRLIYRYKNLTSLVQAVVGVKIDGKCGKDTKAAIKAYQKKHGLTADGDVGLNTWKVILGVK